MAVAALWYAMGYVTGMITVRRLNGLTVDADWLWALAFAFLGPLLLWVMIVNWNLRRSS